MLAVQLCGPRVIARLESIGITKLDDLAPRDPQDLVGEVNIEAGDRSGTPRRPRGRWRA